MARIDRVITKPPGRIGRWLGFGPKVKILKGEDRTTASLETLDGVQPVPIGWRHHADIYVPECGSVRVRIGP